MTTFFAGFFVLIITVGFQSGVLSESIPQQSLLQSNVTCQICTVIANLAEALIKKENLTAPEIMIALQDVCNILPKSVQPECTLVVNNYLQKIIDELVDGESPASICSGLTFCPTARFIDEQTRLLKRKVAA